MLARLFTRFSHAWRGLRFARHSDTSFQLQFYGGAILCSITLTVLHPLSHTEVLFLILGWFLIMITELQNSAVEIALDHLHPDTHHSIGASKDMAASAVLLAGVFLLIVLSTIMYTHVLTPLLF